jgi:tRNA(fMet)-specific endonuclease VapC
VKVILDTNAVSALMKGDPEIIQKLQQRSKEEITVPQPVLAEIAYGIERLPKSKRKERLKESFELIRSELARENWSDDVSETFGRIKATLEKRGQRIEDFDAAIAAHALARDATLVTANLDHMTRVPGLTVEDWSAGGPSEAGDTSSR